MYIPEFWCGVIATVVSEIVVVFVLILYGVFRMSGKENTQVESETMFPSTTNKLISLSGSWALNSSTQLLKKSIIHPLMMSMLFLIAFIRH
jgi:hypothetical protein